MKFDNIIPQLVSLLRNVTHTLDDCEVRDDEVVITKAHYQQLSDRLDEFETLPDKPGFICGPAVKVSHAIDGLYDTHRQSVYFAIDSERAHQNRLIVDPTRPDLTKEASMGSIILAMEKCLDDARRAWYGDKQPYKKTTEYLRKVAALAVQAGERFGMPERK